MPTTPLWAIVPIKRLAQAKSRLAEMLPGASRRDLAAAMARDVIAALRGSGAFDQILVVADASCAATISAGAGCIVAAHPDGGLSDAVRQGFEHARQSGAGQVLFVPADIPLVTAAALRGAAAQLRERTGVAIAACAGKDGTNLLGGKIADMPALAFGPGSYARHVQGSQGSWDVTDSGIAFDVDQPEDLMLLRARIACGASEAAHTRDWAMRNPMADAEIDGLQNLPLARLAAAAAELRDAAYGARVTYSKKVFIPLTHLCRDTCGYCIFARAPSAVAAPYMEIEEAVAVAARGADVGCKEALLTLGERPEDRYRVAREWLDQRDYPDTIAYVIDVAAAIRDRTGLLPHINMGVLNESEFVRLREVSASVGSMLENIAPRLSERGGPHFAAPDKHPERLLAMLGDAGRAQVPFTTGLLVGIGETRAERIATILAIRDAHARHGHVQEVIVQNFLPKLGTKMQAAAPAEINELRWTIAVARLLLPAEISIQAPPNLNDGRLADLADAGINDWGGVSPLTPDYVNPESPWPSLERLRAESDAAGLRLTERLTVYPNFIAERRKWIAPGMRPAILALADTRLLAREDNWMSGRSTHAPMLHALSSTRTAVSELLDEIEDRGAEHFGAAQVAALFEADDFEFHRLSALADAKRTELVGDRATYVVNRNINYTNICAYRCSFCAFSKGNRKHPGNEAAYLLDSAEIGRRTREAWDRGASEVCLQGGIHPKFTGETYLGICKAVKDAVPEMHIHAFSPLEVQHGAQTLGLPLDQYLASLKAAGLGSLPGTAAEILNDDVRRIICPDKVNTVEWLEVIETAHEQGLPTTSTIMFGHVEGYGDWGIHLVHIRDLQRRTGGITEFVPLPFVAHEAPMFRKGLSRRGPTFREAVLMHAVSRLVLAPHIANIQGSWVKMGPQGLAACLRAGANDLGGLLMDESITRAAGAMHGTMMTPDAMAALARSVGRLLERRTTTYRRYEEALTVAT